MKGGGVNPFMEVPGLLLAVSRSLNITIIIKISSPLAVPPGTVTVSARASIPGPRYPWLSLIALIRALHRSLRQQRTHLLVPSLHTVSVNLCPSLSRALDWPRTWAARLAAFGRRRVPCVMHDVVEVGDLHQQEDDEDRVDLGGRSRPLANRDGRHHSHVTYHTVQ